MDQDAPQAELRHRILEHLERGVRVLPRNRREAEEAAGVLPLGLGTQLVQRERNILRLGDRKRVDVAERRGTGDDRVDPRRLVYLELLLELVEVRTDREPPVGRQLEEIPIAVP